MLDKILDYIALSVVIIIILAAAVVVGFFAYKAPLVAVWTLFPFICFWSLDRTAKFLHRK